MMARALRVEGLVVGLCLIGVGVLWTLSNLGLLDLLHTLRRWWPMSLVIWGALELYNCFVARLSRGPER
jgi:hypothetical protein